MTVHTSFPFNGFFFQGSRMTDAGALKEALMADLATLSGFEGSQPLGLEGRNAAANCLLSFYRLGRQGHRLSEGEVKELADVFRRVEKPLVSYLDSFLGMFYVPWEGCSNTVCQIRSGLQFLLDDYSAVIFGEKPGGDDRLAAFKEKIDLKELNSCLKQWKDHAFEIPKRPIDVPKSHFWWL